jgi:hypothetical protein
LENKGQQQEERQYMSTRHQVVVLPAEWCRKNDKTRRKTERQQEDKLLSSENKGHGQEERKRQRLWTRRKVGHQQHVN